MGFQRAEHITLSPEQVRASKLATAENALDTAKAYQKSIQHHPEGTIHRELAVTYAEAYRHRARALFEIIGVNIDDLDGPTS